MKIIMKWKEKKIQDFYDNRVKKTKHENSFKTDKKAIINEKIRELHINILHL